jgi:hypothetical protein
MHSNNSAGRTKKKVGVEHHGSSVMPDANDRQHLLERSGNEWGGGGGESGSSWQGPRASTHQGAAGRTQQQQSTQVGRTGKYEQSSNSSGIGTTANNEGIRSTGAPSVTRDEGTTSSTTDSSDGRKGS